SQQRQAWQDNSQTKLHRHHPPGRPEVVRTVNHFSLFRKRTCAPRVRYKLGLTLQSQDAVHWQPDLSASSTSWLAASSDLQQNVNSRPGGCGCGVIKTQQMWPKTVI